MRFLIVAVSVLVCVAAAPSGLYGQGLLANANPWAIGQANPWAIGHGAALAAPLGLGHAAPTISSGDIEGAAIDAHVEATDHARANLDAAREYQDQAAEAQRQAIDAAEDHAWASLEASQTAHAQHDGAAAAAAPTIARQLAGHGAHGYASHGYAAHGYAAPIAAHGYAAPFAGHGIASPVIAGHGLAGTHSVSSQSLTQTHPAPSAYSHGIGHGYASPLIAGHGIAVPISAHGISSPLLAGHGALSHGIAGTSSVATQSLSQTHPAPSAYGHLGYGHGLAHGHGHAW